MDRRQIEKRQARHNSSIFELNTQSVMLTDILDALKTEQPDDVLDDYRLQSIEFLRKMLEHLHELCLTKMSNKDVEMMTMRYVEAVATNRSLKTLLIEYFGELVPEVEKLVDRLRRVNYKKFTNLIRRKLSEMFSQIMRYAYDIKMSVLVERIKEKERERTTYRLLSNLMNMMKTKVLVPWAFGRIHSLYASQIRGHAHMYDRLLRAVSNLDRLARLRDLKLQAGYFGLWHRQSVELGQDNENQICNLVKTIYLSIITVIEDEQEMHSIINLALRKISGSEMALFKVFRAVQGNTVAYEGGTESPRVNPTSNKETQCFTLAQNDVVYEEAEDEGSPFRIMLVPVRCSSGSTIGLFSVPLLEEMNVKVLQNIFGLARGLADILHNIYLIRHRLNYYDRDCCRTLNQLSQRLLLKLFDMKQEEDWQQHLDMLFMQVSMDNFEILFCQQNRHQIFYQFVNEQSITRHVQLTASAIQIFKQQFEEDATKGYVTINRKQSGFTIFPIREDGRVRGFIKFSYPYEVPLAGLVEILDKFVSVLICRSSEKQPKKCEIVEVKEVQRPINIIQNGLEIVKAQTFEDVIDSVRKSTQNAFQNQKYYCTVLWPMPTSKSAKYFWTICNGILKQPASSGTIGHLVRSALTVQKISLPQSDPLSQILKNFPIFKNNKISEYQNHDASMKMHTYTVRNRVDETLFIVVLASLTEDNLQKQRLFLQQIGTYIKLATERQQHTPRSIPNTHSLSVISTKYTQISYDNFYESVSNVLKQVYNIDKATLFNLERKKIVNKLTAESTNFGYHLPTESYCSSAQATQNYYMRFQNKVYLHNKTQFGFRCQDNRTAYDEVNRSEEVGLVMASSAAMKIIESLTTGNYTYIPLSMNCFILLEGTSQMKCEEVGDLCEWLKKEMDKKKDFDALTRKERLAAAVKSYILRETAEKEEQVRTIVRKFEWHLQNQQQKGIRLFKTLYQVSLRRKLVLQSIFSELRQCQITNKIRMKQTQSKLSHLVETLKPIYLADSFRSIANMSAVCLRKQLSIQTSTKSIFKLINRLVQSTTSNAFFDIFSYAAQIKNNKQSTTVKSMHILCSLISSKCLTAMKQTIETMKCRYDSIIELINIVAEELNMLEFSKEQQLLQFLQQRISYPFDRLHSPYDTMKIEFNIGKSTQSLKWLLDNSTYFIVRLTKLRFQGKLKNNLQNLTKCVQKKWKSIRERNLMRVTSICRAICNMESNSVRYAVRCLQKNVRKCIKDDNKRSKMSLKDIECQLQQLSQNVEVNNDTGRQLTDLKKQIVSKQEEFEDLKMDNVIKKKTLAVALLIANVDDRSERRVNQRLVMRNLEREVTNKETEMVKRKLELNEKELKWRRKEGGLKMLRRSAAESFNRNVRYGFEAVLAMAFRHIR